MHPILTLAAAVAFTPLLLAQGYHQGTYWVANRRSDDIQEIDQGGNTLRSITLSGNLRSAHVAPDGKVWVVRFIQSNFDVVDPATGTVNSVANPTGNPYSIAFDRAGHAWVSGGTSVQEYDANGGLIASYPLAAGAPLGITVDNRGNKWIAHRISPPTVSRIDGATGTVTSHTVPTGSTMLPVDIIADYRDFTSGQPSHIWVTGDSSGDFAEFDDQGNFLNIYQTGLSSVSGIAGDLNGHLWIVSRSGVLNQYDNAGMLLNTYGLSVTDALDVSVDYFGRLWVTDRDTFSCPTPPCAPCEVLRVDPATGNVEVPALAGIGTQSQLSTLFHHASVVDPLGDLDGDGNVNIGELLSGTSPDDAASNLGTVITLGSSQLGGSVGVEFRAAGSITSSILISATAAAASTLPGFAGELLVGVPVIVALPVTANSYTVTLPVPNDPALDGAALYLQGLIVTGVPTATFTNRTSIRIWQ